MAATSGINNVPQIYGNGLVLMQGGFTDGGTPTVAHGKGFSVARTTVVGCYLVTLTYGFKGAHSIQVDIVAPASQLANAYSHPGWAIPGDLQVGTSNGVSTNGNTFYVYTYQYTSGTQTWIPGSGTLCEFTAILSQSNLNP